MKTIKIIEGECISSIAALHGFFWKTVWNTPDNAQLRALRPSPNLLRPGDIVIVPELRSKTEFAACEQKHRFRRKGIPALLKIRLLNNGEPRQGVGWKACLDGIWQNGATDSNGLLQIRLAPSCNMGLLRVEDGTEYRLLLRELDPLETVSGIQARLNNLGYESGTVDGIQGPITSGAIRRFQKDYPPLTVDGVASPQTRAKLKEIYGC